MSITKVKNNINHVKAKRRSVKKTRVKPVAELLSVEVIESLRNQLAEPITASRVREMAIAYDTAHQYGVTARRLGIYWRKLKKAAYQLNKTNMPSAESESEQTTEQINNPSDKNESDDWSKRVQSHRRRQVTIASILDSTFGAMAENSPDLWAKRAYLLLVGVVYDRLAADEQGIGTDELIKLAKALAEGRRAELRAKDTEGAIVPTQHALTSGTMPKHLADTVRKIYGVRIEDSATSDVKVSEESSPADSSSSRLSDDL